MRPGTGEGKMDLMEAQDFPSQLSRGKCIARKNSSGDRSTHGGTCSDRRDTAEAEWPLVMCLTSLNSIEITESYRISG